MSRRGHRLVALALLLGGCGDDLVPTIALEDFAAASRDAECAYLTRCGLFSSVTACQRFLRVAPDRDLLDAVETGSVAYDAAWAAVCLDETAARSCSIVSPSARVRPACDRVFTGMLDGGDVCALDESCRSGACEVPACPDACCRGACRADVAPGPAGAPCVVRADCEGEAFCDASGVCQPPRGVGEACRRDDQCVAGAGCIGAGIMEGTCRELPALGEPCPYGRCADIGARCDDSAGACVSWGSGAPCASDADCSFYGLCDVATGTCGPVPTLGMPCATRCGGDAWCDRSSASPICAELKPDGAPCATADQCRSLTCVEGPAFDFCATLEPCS